MEKQNRIPYNIQFFAEGGEGAGGAGGNEGGEGSDGGADDKTQTKTPSLKELLKDKDFASELDQHVSKAITTAKTKWDEDAKLTAEQLAQKKTEEQNAALNKREADLAMRELRADMAAEIGKRSLPSTLIDAVNLGGGKDAALLHLGELEKTFRASVDAAVNEKLKGTPPPAGGGGEGGSFQHDFRAAVGLKDPAK